MGQNLQGVRRKTYIPANFESTKFDLVYEESRDASQALRKRDEVEVGGERCLLERLDSKSWEAEDR